MSDQLENCWEDEEASSLPPTPDWKLQLLQKKKKSITSASFSHFDRPQKPQKLCEEPPDSLGATTKDIINFFNGPRDGGGGGLWSGQQQLRPPAAASPAGMCGGLARSARTAGRTPVSCAVERRPGSGNKWSGQPGQFGLAGQQEQDGDCDLIWTNTDDFSHPLGLVLGSHMGEEKRLFISNGRPEADAVRVSGVGARLYRGRLTGVNKRNLGRGGGGAASGDSDGMTGSGSGGESDSSEEIHYGPGFVSRLKSRYMSVALRGSPRGSLGTLRRTASLEDFLEIDKNRDEEEVELRQSQPPLVCQFSRQPRGVPAAGPVQQQGKVAAKVRWKLF